MYFEFLQSLIIKHLFVLKCVIGKPYFLVAPSGLSLVVVGRGLFFASLVGRQPRVGGQVGEVVDRIATHSLHCQRQRANIRMS